MTTRPSKPSSRRSRPVTTGRDRVAGVRGSTARMSRCPVITAGHAVVDRRRERRQVDPAQLPQRAVLHRQREVAVGGHRAVAREVLEDRHHAAVLQPARRGARLLADQSRVGARRPGPDRRVGRSAGDVGVRGEVDGEPETGELGGVLPVDAGGELRVAGGARAHEGGERRRRRPLDDPALLVDGEEQRPAAGRPGAAAWSSPAAIWPGEVRFSSKAMTPPRCRSRTVRTGAAVPDHEATMTWPASAGSGSRLTCRTASSSSRSVGPQPVRSPSSLGRAGRLGLGARGGLRRLVRLAGRRGLAAVALAAGGGQEHDGERARAGASGRVRTRLPSWHGGRGARPIARTAGSVVGSPHGSEQRRWPGWVYAEGEEPDYRFSLANERTLLAWLRTALALLAAGSPSTRSTSRWTSTLQLALAAVLVLLGVVCAAASWWRWAERRAGDPAARAAALARCSACCWRVGTIAHRLVVRGRAVSRRREPSPVHRDAGRSGRRSPGSAPGSPSPWPPRSWPG